MQIFRQHGTVLHTAYSFSGLVKCCFDAEPRLWVPVFFGQRIGFDDESVIFIPTTNRPRKPQLPRSPSSPSKVIELRYTLGTSIELSDLRYIKSFSEFLPDFASQSIASCYDALLVAIVRRRWRAEDVSTEFADIDLACSARFGNFLPEPGG